MHGGDEVYVLTHEDWTDVESEDQVNQPDYLEVRNLENWRVKNLQWNWENRIMRKFWLMEEIVKIY
jgi:hypothetical protein